MLRSGEGGYLVTEFLEKKIGAIGWNKIGDLSKVKEPLEIKDKLRTAYSDYSEGQINNFAGQIYRFRCEFQKGDKVLTYDPNTRKYWIGEVKSDYTYKGKETEYHHVREVNWSKSVPRDVLSTSTKNSLGSTLTIFSIPQEVEEELLRAHEENKNVEEVVAPVKDETLEILKDDFEAKARGFISDKILLLNWDEFQELVAGLLRGMGYKTFISPKGSDRGKDIVASPDGLGLENPRIVVEVKHRKGTMGAPEIRSFLGGLRPSDKGLYVSTGGFTKEAKYEADRANIPITLVDSELLVSLIIQHYDNFDQDTRSIVPLRKVYWPV
ncbi:MAG: restriction endonuclease [Bacteroidia bacterium]|nr:restriction endonuclease [Bacteroidia bacterium]